MKKVATLFTLLISVAAFAGSGSKPKPDRIWITDAILISPENLDHIEKGSVLIEDGRITRVERTEKAKPPDGAIVVSGNGQYLIPGLMDSHVHLSSIPGIGMMPDQVKLDEPLAKSYFKHEALVEPYLKQLPRSYLYYGYTTLVDLVAPFPQELNDFRHEPCTQICTAVTRRCLSQTDIPCRTLRQMRDLNCFRISFTTRGRRQVFRRSTGRKIT